MSMATRCLACGTIFRVVADQLKVSDGWVRCGRCDEVFNAGETLFDLEHDSPPPWQPGHAALPRAGLPDTGGEDAPEAADLDEEDRIASRFFHHDADELAPPAEAAASAPSRAAATVASAATSSAPGDPATPAGRGSDLAATAAAAPVDGDAPADTPAQAPPAPDDEAFTAHDAVATALRREARVAPEDAAAGGSPGGDAASAAPERVVARAAAGAVRTDAGAPAAAADAELDDAPPFVRAADARARWETPRARLALALAALLLVLVLALQVGHHFRDDLAARHAGLRPVLAGWCAQVGCRLGPPRRIDDISVESTALARATTGTDAYRLAVTLRNRGDVPVALPSIDLTLTDSAGQLVARRALAPADFRAASPVVAPGSEVALQLVLSAGGARVVGYTVEAFYP